VLNCVSGKISEVIYVQIGKDADLLAALKQAVVQNDIKTGIVVDITGGLIKATLQKFETKSHDPKIRVGVVEMEGPLKVSGHGLIGMTRGTGGMGDYKDGEPYVKVHLVVSSCDETYCGQLMPGTIVRSHLDMSHFTVVLAKVENVSLTAAFTPTEDGKGRIYHELRPA
jgi:predicted DNA-binding protein with PD1-like motif